MGMGGTRMYLQQLHAGWLQLRRRRAILPHLRICTTCVTQRGMRARCELRASDGGGSEGHAGSGAWHCPQRIRTAARRCNDVSCGAWFRDVFAWNRELVSGWSGMMTCCVVVALGSQRESPGAISTDTHAHPQMRVLHVCGHFLCFPPSRPARCARGPRRRAAGAVSPGLPCWRPRDAAVFWRRCFRNKTCVCVNVFKSSFV